MPYLRHSKLSYLRYSNTNVGSGSEVSKLIWDLISLPRLLELQLQTPETTPIGGYFLSLFGYSIIFQLQPFRGIEYQDIEYDI